MACESPKRKMCYAFHAVFWFILFGVSGGFYLDRWSNANKIDSYYCDDPNILTKALCNVYKDKYYDNLFWNGPYSASDLNEA